MVGAARAGPASPHRKAIAYSCPMHPQYRLDHPGDCPSCGMRLVPVGEAGEERMAGEEGTALPGRHGAGDPERQQRIGVRLGVVERVSGTRTLRTTGRVAPNENAVYPLVASVAYECWGCLDEPEEDPLYPVVYELWKWHSEVKHGASPAGASRSAA